MHISGSGDRALSDNARSALPLPRRLAPLGPSYPRYARNAIPRYACKEHPKYRKELGKGGEGAGERETVYLRILVYLVIYDSG